MKYQLTRAFGLFALIFSAALQLPAQTADLTPKSVLNVMQHVADWQLANPPTATNQPPTGWIQAAGDAGMMALVNQNMAVNNPTVSGRQGNANYALYNLASKQTPSNCNSSTGPASTCRYWKSRLFATVARRAITSITVAIASAAIISTCSIGSRTSAPAG